MRLVRRTDAVEEGTLDRLAVLPTEYAPFDRWLS